MKVVLGRPLLVARGTVHSVGESMPMKCVLQQPDGGFITCSLPAPMPSLRRGEVISVILLGRANAGAALGLVNHATIDGENYVRLTARHRPDAWDGVLLSAGCVGVMSALGTDGLVPVALLAAAYWLLAVVIPTAWRERLARRVDSLIDREARGLQAAVLPDESTWPARSDKEGP